MRVIIEADSQEEFEAKRPQLLKALGGADLIQTRPGEEPYYEAEKQMLEYWDGRFKQTLEAIKREVLETIR